jgi:hypothetical protein
MHTEKKACMVYDGRISLLSFVCGWRRKEKSPQKYSTSYRRYFHTLRNTMRWQGAADETKRMMGVMIVRRTL